MNSGNDIFCQQLKLEAWEAFKCAVQRNEHCDFEDEITKTMLKSEFEEYWNERLKLIK